MTDWHTWHEAYDDPDSSLTKRLAVVRRRIAEALAPSAVGQVLSLCAGDGRDVLPILASVPRDRQPETVLVELDPTLAAAARETAAASGVAVSVINDDAGWAPNWQASTPVDLLLLCGIFGNVSDDDIRTTVRSVPSLLQPDGTVIWTRGHLTGHDVRPHIREWFRDAGLDEIAFDSEPVGYGVGVNRRPATTSGDEPIPERLFSFVR